MSIFKETFRDYVRDQLSIRDKVISRGNSGTENGAMLYQEEINQAPSNSNQEKKSPLIQVPFILYLIANV
jgi:hypothetical protein